MEAKGSYLKAQFHHPWGKFEISLSSFFDLSIPVSKKKSLSAFHIPGAEFFPFQAGSFTGSVEQGGSCNCEKILFTPHGNGTHTECFGHISSPVEFPFQLIQKPFLLARLATVEPSRDSVDKVIHKKQLLGFAPFPEAFILRTLPNGPEKLQQNYSGKNPPYLSPQSASFLAEKGVEHLLIDLPSVDPEEDGGKLLSHRAFWQYPHSTRKYASITEMIYVDNAIPDGLYFLNLQIISLESDACPSRPLLFPLEVVDES